MTVAEHDRPSGAPGPGRILVVDDEAVVLRLLERALGAAGYDVHGTESPRDGVAAFEAAPDAFDLALIDLTMRTMTGTVLAAELRAIRPELQIVLMSGHAEEDVRRGAGCTQDVFLQKPFSIEALLATVAGALPHAN